MSNGSKVTVDTKRVIGTASPFLYGQFIEHLGRCVYDGLWVEEGSPIENIRGMRAEVVRGLKAVGTKIMRWPGGCFADSYHWREGIGPREQRPMRANGPWGGAEPNTFGTMEFMDFCHAIETEPYLCVNVGGGTIQEAVDWVEFCNRTDTSLADLRGSLGHPEPFKVKYWAVGNENWGCGGAFDPKDYAGLFRRFAIFMRQSDSVIQLIACGNAPGDWNLRFIEAMRNELGMVNQLSIHQYLSGGHQTEFSEADYYKSLADVEEIEKQVLQAAAVIRYFTQGRQQIGIAVDEWGIWHPQADRNLEQSCTLRDAVFAGTALNTMTNLCHLVSMANIAQTVNVLHCLLATKGAATIYTPTYHTFALLNQHSGHQVVHCEAEVDTVPLAQASLTGKMKLPAVNVCASLDPQTNELLVTLVNQHYKKPQKVRLTVREQRLSAVQSRQLWAEAANAVNDVDQPARVTITAGQAEVKGREVVGLLPPHSVTAWKMSSEPGQELLSQL